MEFLYDSFYGNTVLHWLTAVGATLLLVAGFRVIVALLTRRLSRLAQRTATRWDDLIAHTLSKTNILVLIFLGIYVGAMILILPDRLRGFLQKIAILCLLLQTGIWLNAAVSFLLIGYRATQAGEDAIRAMTAGLVSFLAKVVVWSVVLLMTLDNLGVDITALVAGLGVGGIAVALAVQNILGDLLASLSIVFDKPFVPGDFLAIDSFLGSVEQIGLKTTRLRSLSGEQLIFSNADLLQSRIRNYGRMAERRVVFTIGVTYQTPRAKIVEIPKILREAVEAQEKIRFDRSHFQSYGESALNFETVYYVLSPEYNLYMDIQQRVLLRIHERFEAEGIDFAYPTRTLFLMRGEAEGAQAEGAHAAPHAEAVTTPPR
ncbi:MAG: mechanosensitive ion channel family protein [Candidatus Eisenbacteria bacterium]|nr:mechanosensitive ion channel family protein [Candidatus Eisenbacteria bacterium]